jgi:3-oxoadipate enol-lactonase
MIRTRGLQETRFLVEKAMQNFTVNHITLAYDRLGKGAPLVLIHGFPLDHSIWDEVTPLLSSDFELILPDLRGFGQSGSPASAWTMTDLAKDIASLLDHLGIKSAFLAGHSMGGYVALAFAQAYPRRVRGLALVASQAAADTPERKEGRYATASQVAEQGTGGVVDGMTTKLSGDARVQAFVRGLMEKQTAAGVIGSLKAMAERKDRLSILASASFPLLLIHGNADILIPMERAREIKAAVPRAQLVELAGISHMPMMESPQAVADALKSSWAG